MTEGIFIELITNNHHQVRMTLMRLRRSLGQSSSSASDGIEILWTR